MCLMAERPKRSEKDSALSSFCTGSKPVLIVTDASLRGLGEELPPVVSCVSISLFFLCLSTPSLTPVFYVAFAGPRDLLRLPAEHGRVRDALAHRKGRPPWAVHDVCE